MLDEDTIDIPDAWYVAVHPRRGGMAAWQYPVTDEHRAAVEALRQDGRAELRAILGNPNSDRALVARYREADGSLASEGVRLAVDVHLVPEALRIALMDTCIQRLGLARAAAVAVTSAAVSVDYVYLKTAGGPRWTQVRRLEEAMVVQRSWTGAEFAATICAQPLLGRLARRLVWRADDRTAVVDALGDLVGVDGAPLPSPSDVRLAHPATSDLTPWRGWMASVVQPFPQIEREVLDDDPSAHWNRTVSAASLYALLRRGWQWGPTGRAALRDRIVRPLGSAGTVVLAFGPGLSAVHDAAGEPDQVVEWLNLESPRHGELAVVGDLPRVTRSELARDLRLLT